MGGGGDPSLPQLCPHSPSSDGLSCLRPAAQDGHGMCHPNWGAFVSERQCSQLLLRSDHHKLRLAQTHQAKWLSSPELEGTVTDSSLALLS